MHLLRISLGRAHARFVCCLHTHCRLEPFWSKGGQFWTCTVSVRGFPRKRGSSSVGYVHRDISAYQPIFIHLALSAIQDTQYLHRPLKLYQPIYTNNREKSVLYKQGRESHASNQSGRFSRAVPDIGSGALLQGLIYSFNL